MTQKRNEPCPCGSGKKFKKCCGFTQAVKRQMKVQVLRQNPLTRLQSGVLDNQAKEFFDQVRTTHARRIIKALPQGPHHAVPDMKTEEAKEPTESSS